MTGPETPGTYLRYLPEILRSSPVVGALLGAVESVFEELETLIDEMPGQLDPARADPAFLPWLAGWLALPLRADWRGEQAQQAQRDLLRRIVPLYHLRGTAAGLREMLRISLRQDVEVFDDVEQAHFFAVRLTLNAADEVAVQRIEKLARAIIEQEKPAHTYYALRISVPMMRLVSPDLRDRERGAGLDTQLLVLGGETGNTLLGSRPAT